MKSEQPFHNPNAWSEATYRDRGADLEAILDTILKEKSFQANSSTILSMQRNRCV